MGVAQQKVFRVNEFYEALGKRPGRGTIYRHIEMGLIKSAKVGERIYIPASELNDYPQRLVEAHAQGREL